MTPAFAPPRPLAPANRIRVLVADDSVVVRGLIARWLQESGIEVVATVSNGRLAIAALDRVAPDIVLLDLDMPGLPWVRIVDRVRKDAPQARIVAFTGSTIEPRLDAFDAWLPKPATPDAILDAVGLTRPGEPKRPPPG